MLCPYRYPPSTTHWNWFHNLGRPEGLPYR